MPVVSTHFSLNDHSLTDFSFLIYNKDINCTDKRRSIELDLIHIFSTLNQKLLNKDIKKRNFISNLCFSN